MQLYTLRIMNEKIPNTNYPFVSVVIPVYNEEFFIENCLDSILVQDYPIKSLEIIVVNGNSSDRTKQIINERYPKVIVLDNPDKIVPISMNIGIKQSKGDYIVRLDAHTLYPKNYISTLIAEIQRLNADNVGAICRTLPANDTFIAQAIAIALGTKFGMGNSGFRVGVREVKEVDTVPFGCFPRSVFEKIGYYDEELIRNQDDELNGRIIKNGGKIFLLPNLIVDYYGRDSLKKVFKMFYQYGLFKPLGNKKLGRPATLRQFAPLLFVSGILVGFPISIHSSLFRLIYLIGIAIYVILCIIFSILNSPSIKIMFSLLTVYPTIHFAYGWGYIVGIYKIIFNRPFVALTNR